jgi:uncharacterized protein (TIGR03083 family)
MQQSTAATDTQDAQAIPPVTPDEAVTMASVELDRFLALIASLTAQEWEAPTDCTLWNVRQVVAHVAGALTAYADEHLLLQRIGPWLGGPQGGPGMTMALFIADVTGMPQARRDAYRDLGLNPLDALNQYQVDEREHATPQELMEEIRAAGPAAIANRRSMPDSIRDIQLPVTGVMAPVHYLTDVIYPRDMWMHRMEIALATGRSIARTSDHEGRLTALVMRDLARRLARSLGNRTVVYHLAGPDGGRFRFGGGQEPDTVLSMDAVDFHLLASSRRAPEALTVDISGDGELARQILGETTVGY